MTRRHPLPLCLVAALTLASCSMPRFLSQQPQIRGNRVTPDQLAQLIPGTTTRTDVSSLLGSPTATASFNDNQWIYISEVTVPVIGGTEGVRDQQVYVLNFNNQGVLSGVEHRTKRDSEPVDVVARTTPTPGSSASFMQQLLGNIGKFSPGSDLGGSEKASNPGNF